MIYVVATLTIKPDSLAALREAAMPCIEATREEHGCIFYDLNTSVSNSRRVVFVEQWKSREDLENHFNTAHIKAFREASAPLIESRTVEIIHPERIETL
ncbi:putative quinol monooxygenase [Oricola nitratireducens]|jgi:quinol monooxygenase YgiN|uniref:putative quinol monooxygenase n=1 Tax=Oricola nitratireducens TaxID=2775868 RepID=UPI00186950EB|nr:putative quinol monooxygenase [Oricola nitratireducens]